MSGLERTRRSLAGAPGDRVPTFPIMIASACRLVGVRQRDYSLDPDVMASTLLRARALCGFDGIYVSRDNWVSYEALGGVLSFPEDDEPFARTALLDSAGAVKGLSVPDPRRAPGMKTVLAAARAVVEQAGADCYVQANIDTGPFSLAGVLRGTQDFLSDISLEDKGRVDELLSFCTETVIAYGREMIATGVHGIQFGESTASLVSPADYERFALPWQRRVAEALAGHGCDVWMHICGRTGHILPFVGSLAIDGLEVDAAVGLDEARRMVGERMTLKGNLDTSFLRSASAAAVQEACRALLRSAGAQGRFVLSPGCGVPRDTPVENLRAMVRACEAAAGSISGRSRSRV